MNDRYIEFSNEEGSVFYNTRNYFMTAMQLSDPKPKLTYVNVPGRSTPIDLSEIFDGELIYEQRSLKAQFVTNDDTIDERWNKYVNLFNFVQGKKRKIELPDFPAGRYLLGRCQFALISHNVNYLKFEINATCDPWIYSSSKVSYTISEEDSEKDIYINNRGDTSVIPSIEIIGGPITIKYYEVDPISLLPIKTFTHTLSEGTYRLPTLKVWSSGRHIYISGSGTLIISIQEGSHYV
ncbi:MAG: hypothetical protein ACI4II_06310 [Acutalibacteraceae bacterium]